jgi:signal transduction histidine kinase
MQPQFLKAVAFTLAAINVCLVAAVALLIALNGGETEQAISSLADLPPSLSFSLVGTLIIWRRSSHVIGWLLLLIGLPLVIEHFGVQYATYTLLAYPGSLPGGAFASWLTFGVFGLSYGAIVLLVLLFPTGRPLSPRWTWVGVIGMGGVVLWTVIAYVATWKFRGPLLLQDVYPPELESARSLGLGILGLVTAAFLAAVVSAILRLRRSSGVERQQLKWFVYAATLAVGVMLMLIITDDDAETALENIVGLSLFSFAFSAIPLAIGIAILRYRLWDIDFLINRTLVYGSLTASVVGLYVLLVGGLGAVFQTGGRGNVLISLIATAVVAVFFAPLRDRLQRGVNRLLYGQRDDPYAVLSRLGQQLEATLAPEAVLPTIVTTVKEALKLPYAAIALDQEGRSVEVAAAGTLAPNPLCLPLTYQGETIGQLILAPRAPGETFSPAERRLLADLAHQAGVAAAAVRLTADLRRSRERLVTTREEERRRLRRDLHDGLGPALAAHTLKIGTARALLTRDPTAADVLLAELESDIQTALADIRRLVYNLRPPSLDELGLIGAIRETAARYSAGENGGGRLQMVIEAPNSLPPLPAAVEVAAYRIVQEALTNVVRHAQAQHCTIKLTITEPTTGDQGREAGDELREEGVHGLQSPVSRLELEITDDGIGLPPGRHVGVGLASMRERTQELGGTYQIETAPTGGVRVVAQLPLPKKEELKALGELEGKFP